MTSPDYYPDFNGLALTQHSEDLLITYCLTLIFIVFCAFLLFIYFKDSIFWTLSRTRDSIHHISLYIAYIFNTLFGLYAICKELQQLQPQDIREQLIVFSFTEQASPIQEIQQECCDSQVFEMEQLFSHTPNVLTEHTYAPLVVCNDCAFTKFIQGKERCLKFISQDLTFLQSSSIPSTFSNISNMDGASVKVREPLHIQLLTHIPQENTDSPTYSNY